MDDDRDRRVDRLQRAIGKRVEYWSSEAELSALEQQHADALAADDARQRRRLRARRIEGLPLTTADVSAIAAETHTRTRPVLAVDRFLLGEAPTLVLSGTTGCGKTCAGAHGLASVGGDYARAPELARCFAALFGEDVERREALIESDRLVVVDDIGAELRADLMAVALLELIDARRRGQRTIWITNLSRGDFESRYSDPRLHSRLAQSSLWVVDAGVDLRRGR